MTASFARRSVSEKARSRFGSTFSVPTSRRRNGAEGPNGWTLSSRTTRPCGFRENPTSTSAGDVPKASARVCSTIRPPPSTSCTWTRCIPRTSCDRKWTISSIEWPTHASGASRICVSPWTGGTSGPTKTVGYPNRQTKTPGGEDPSISTRSIIGAVFIMKSHRTRIGQRALPQRSFAPRHCMHNPLAIAACVSASKIAANVAGAGWTGRESIAVPRTERGLMNVATGWAKRPREGLSVPPEVPEREGEFAARHDDGRPDPPLLLRLPEHGGAVCPAAGSHAKSDRLRGGNSAQAPVSVPRRDGPRRLPHRDEGAHRRRETTHARVLPRPARLGACDGDQGAPVENPGAREGRRHGEGGERRGHRPPNVRPPDSFGHRAGSNERRRAGPRIPRGNR